MAGTIFVRGKSGLVEVGERAYDTEDVLQSILEEHPRLLAGDQMNPDDPRTFLFVAREVSIPIEEGGVGWWSLDHLFVDQYMVPTLVEVKRKEDTRIRRNVIGQMLDYASNAALFLTSEKIAALFDATCKYAGREPEAELQSFLGPDSDTAGFWDTVGENLNRARPAYRTYE